MRETDLLVLWPTTRCNLRCRYCYARAESSGEDMDFETAVTVLKRFSDQKIKIQFAGGEPLLCPEFLWKTAEYIKMHHPEAPLQIQTNGTRITPQIAKKLKYYGFRVGISLDGPREVNDWQRGHTAEVYRGLECLREYGIETGINAVLTKRNKDKIAELPELSLVFPNIRGIAVDLLRRAGRAAETDELCITSAEETGNALKALYEKTRKIERLTGRSLIIREVENAKMRLLAAETPKLHCYASCGRSYVILPQGRIYPCGSLNGQETYYMGSVNQKEAYKKICLDAPAREECRFCSWQKWCDRGCPARYLANKEDGRDAECALRKMAFHLAKREIEENTRK